MTIRNYLLFSAVVTFVWVLALLFVPPFAQTVESLMLTFLSSNA